MKIAAFVPVALAALVLGACAPSPVAHPSFKKVADLALASAPGAEAAREAPAPTSAEAAGPYVERKQVKNGSVTLETADLDAAERALTQKVVALGGFVENTQSQERFRTLSLRVPAGSFDAFLGGLSALGRVTARQVGVSDVTVQFYDLETRLKNQRLLLDQYRTILAKTLRLEDTLAAMERINSLTTDIESTEGQFRYLSRQIDLSSLTVELNLPLAQGGRDWPDWAAGFSDLVHGLADLGVGAVFFVLGAVVVVPVVGLVLWLLVWVLTGPLGLGRRLANLFPRRRRTTRRR